MVDSDGDDGHQDSEKRSEGDAEVLPRTSKTNAVSSDEDDEVGQSKFMKTKRNLWTHFLVSYRLS